MERRCLCAGKWASDLGLSLCLVLWILLLTEGWIHIWVKQGGTFSHKCFLLLCSISLPWVCLKKCLCLEEWRVLEAGDLGSIWGVWEGVREAVAAATSWWDASLGGISKLSDTVTSSKCPCGLAELCCVPGGCQTHVPAVSNYFTNPLVFFCNVCVLQPPASGEVILLLLLSLLSV